MSVIDEIFAEHVKATERTFDQDRSLTVGASEVGRCARQVWWLKHGAEPDADYANTWGARVRGSIFESAFWAPALRRRFRHKLKYAGTAQITLTSGLLSATPDGLVVDQPRDVLAPLIPDIGEGCCFLAECKTADPRTNLANPKSEHVFQLQVQLGLVRAKTTFQPEYAILTYTDASFWHEMRVFVIKFDQAIFGQAIARASRIMKAATFDELQPEGWIAGGRECEYCPYARPCGHDRADVPKAEIVETNTQFAAEVADLAYEAKQYEEDVDTATERLREAQNAIKERLKEHGVRKIKSGDIAVTWSAVKGRKAYNNGAIHEAAIAKGVDIEQFSTVGEPTDRLLIKIG